MNKTFQINLGGISFTIDADAFRRLDLYLHELETHFAHSESRDEIISDIEARLGELLTEKLRGREIVTIKNVADVLKVMGSPSDFEDEAETNESYRNEGGKRKIWDIKTGKRLYRDTDNKVIAGVCSGVAAYLGIEDPLWVRLGFVAIFITGGFGLVAYIIGWALIPEAKTAGDRLAMMGQSANIKNIANIIEHGLDDLSDTLHDSWSDLTKKKDDRDSGRHYMQKSDTFGNDVLVLPPVSLPAKIANTVKRVVKDLSNKNDDSLFV